MTALWGVSAGLARSCQSLTRGCGRACAKQGGRWAQSRALGAADGCGRRLAGPCALRHRVAHRPALGGVQPRRAVCGKLTSDVGARARQGVGKAGQALGAPEFAALLVDAGADARWATAAWTANHLRWVLWKLAALERRHAAALAGRALMAPVVLDQLKYRCAALNPLRLHHHCCVCLVVRTQRKPSWGGC